MSEWHAHLKDLEDALGSLRDANRGGDVVEPPTEDERRRLTFAHQELERQLEELARRAGISAIIPSQSAPDFGTRLNQADVLAGKTIDALNNHNSLTPPNGGARGYVQTAIQRMRDARESLTEAKRAHFRI